MSEKAYRIAAAAILSACLVVPLTTGISQETPQATPMPAPSTVTPPGNRETPRLPRPSPRAMPLGPGQPAKSMPVQMQTDTSETAEVPTTPTPSPSPSPAPVPSPSPSTPASPAPPAVPPPFPKPTTSPVVAEKPSTNESGEELIGIKYADESLDVVLKDYSDYTGRAIMKAPDVPAIKITLKCPKKIPKSEALLAIESVLAMQGIGLVPMGEKFLKVVQITVARKSGMRTGEGEIKPEYKDTDHLISHIVSIRHMDLAEAQNTIQNLLHPYGNVITLQQINSLLITDTSVNIERILEILKRIDQPVEIREELRIYQVMYAKASEIQAKIEAIIADSESKTTRTPFIRRPMPVRGRTTTMPPQGSTTTETKEGIIQGKVKMVSDDRTNSLIIITRAEQFGFFEKMIEALDQQVEPNMSIKVHPLEYAKAEDVLSVLTSLLSTSSENKGTPFKTMPTLAEMQKANAGGGDSGSSSTEKKESLISGTLSSDVKVLSDERSNSLIIMASKGDMEVIQSVIDKLDIMLKQVMMEVIILEIGLRNATQTGVDWLQHSMIAYNEKQNNRRNPLFSFAGASRVSTEGPLIDAASVRSVGSNPTGEGSGLTYFFTLYELNMDAVLNMLAATSEARVLSTPIILTTDNKEAKIIVGEKRPIVTSTSISSGGTQQSAYEYTDIGIELTVTPHINQKGFVVMDIQQKVDNTSGDVEIDGNKVPVITTREFGASIAVNDARTIILGGLSSTDHKKGRVKIPLLGDIPLLGFFFRSDDHQKVRTELLVLITPYVLDTPDKVHDTTATRKDFMSDDEAMWEDNWAQSDFATSKDTKDKDKLDKDGNPREKRSWRRNTPPEKTDTGKQATDNTQTREKQDK